MVREIGDRGRPSVDEGLPPPSQHTEPPTPAHANAPETLAPAPTSTQRSAPEPRIPAESPSMASMSPMFAMEHVSSPSRTEGTGGGLLEVHMALVAKHDATLEKMSQLIAEQQLRAGLTPALPSTDELTTLQARLESLEAAGLLSEEESFALDDQLAEFLAVRALAPAVAATMVSMGASAGKVRQMVDLSDGFAADRRFARQLRRQFFTE